ncbi:MAG: substrate-binding domain-containing protein [gamma proteobacterium endosymbiont of Lamellibrachia anaximandri]|nr:substrate-binding domain-containing protein [gamma proteobacterium endosymbiont of Lamellibrachia anaximandri]
MKTAFVALTGLLASFSITAGTINYEGSSTIGKFISDADKVYVGSSFKVNDDSESLGGEQCATWDTCELGGVARMVDPSALDQGVHAVMIGKDAIAAVVNIRNPVTRLSKTQLRDVFSGKIKNWKALGGDDLMIKPYIVKPASATRHVFQEKVMGGIEYSGSAVVSPDRKIVARVIHERGAIGQISLAFLKSIKRIALISVDGEKPALDNPNYPVTRELNLVTHGEPTGEIKKFIEWTLSPEGQSVVRQRFVGVK